MSKNQIEEAKVLIQKTRERFSVSIFNKWLSTVRTVIIAVLMMIVVLYFIFVTFFNPITESEKITDNGAAQQTIRSFEFARVESLGVLQSFEEPLNEISEI